MNPLDITATRSLPPLTCDNDVFSDSFVSQMDPFFTELYIATGNSGAKEYVKSTLLLKDPLG